MRSLRLLAAAAALLAAPLVAITGAHGTGSLPAPPPTLHTGAPANRVAEFIQPAQDTSDVLLKDWLLVEDNVPWYFDSIADALNRFGYTWDRTTSWAFPFVTLAHYRGVIVASDQVSSFHDNMLLNAPLLQAYVLTGGTLVVNYAQDGWNSYPSNPALWIPGGATYVTGYSDWLTIVNPLSSITVGVTDPDLQAWFYSTHGTVVAPVAAPIIAESTSLLPTFVSYPHGLGKVFVTMQTVEWGYAGDYFGPRHHLLRNELATINTVLPL